MESAQLARSHHDRTVAVIVVLVGAACLLLFPTAAVAQQIGGTITDATGAVLPGVTVEARSPVLIEQVRTAVTDGNGQYLIVALQPGAYTVSYQLAGFNTLLREGIQLTTGFTASIDVQLLVGDLAETITVSGASPVIDIQNVARRQVMDREIIDSIPTGKSLSSYGLLIPGMVGAQAYGSGLIQDAGGLTTQTMQRMSIHGGKADDQMVNINGMDVAEPHTQGGNMGVFPDTNFQEIAFNYSGNSAELETGGVFVNMIPREGANTFRGSAFTSFTFPELMADNLDQDLIDRGLRSAPQIEKNWTISPSFGGPIVKNRLWFYLTHSSQVADLQVPGLFHAVNPAALVYEPDLNRPAVDEATAREQSINLTAQVTSKDKVKAYWTNSSTDRPHYLQGRALGTNFVTPEAAITNQVRTNVYQLTWTRPQTNRLLFEAAASQMPMKYDFEPAPGAVNELPGIMEVSPVRSSRNLGSWLGGGTTHYYSPKNADYYRGSTSYVTGSHNVKVGFTLNVQRTATSGSSETWTRISTNRSLPFRVSFSGGLDQRDEATSLGLYAQEQWTLKRMTVNAGLRWDRVTAGYPDGVRPTNVFVATPFPFEGQTVVTWKDFHPRVGLAYDLRGNGKTALKFSLSRYGSRDSTDWSMLVNPAATNRTMTRSWYDGATGHPFLNIPNGTLPSCIGPVTCIPGDGLVQGDPLNPAPNGELVSPNVNPAFGLPRITTFHDQDWAFGWGKRRANWEVSGGVQHEVISGMSVDVSYFRRSWVHLSVVDDRVYGPDDFEIATVTVPTDSRLPGGGGGTLSFYDLKPGPVRVSDKATTSTDSFGGESQTWQGVDITTNGRFGKVLLQGGVSSGQRSFDYCERQARLPEMVDVTLILIPLEACKRSENWLTQVKLLGSYTLPYDIQIAATLQNQPGPERIAQVQFAGNQTSLGRPLVLYPSAATLNVIAPGSSYGERFNQFDLRLTKIFALRGTARLRTMFDIFNLFNANSVTAEAFGYGPSWLTPQSVMPGRLGKFAFQIDF